MSTKRKVKDGIVKACIFVSVTIVVGLLIAIIGYIFYRGLPNITWNLLTTQRSVLQDNIGILPNLIYTLYIIITSLVIALPVGVCAAIYLTEYATNAKVVRVIEFATETLTGIPSIIFGLVGYLFFCQKLHMGSSVLAGSLTLVVMILPTIVRTTQEALKTVPESYREGAIGLGATRWYMIRTVVLPCTGDGIISGAILAIGRIVGESAALIFTAGMGYSLVTNYFKALGTSGGALSVMLYHYVNDEAEYDTGYAIAAILMILVLIINFGAKIVKRKSRKI
ncbi:MAG: phosphate ABC transporter permease PstA [Oscillospiraceae bacterium]|nr:phosphate ABC transporter permease PstA [Oscillospiraceae bacterium]